MRALGYVAGLALGLGLAGPAWAQRGSFFGPWFFGPTQNQVIPPPDVPIAQPMAVPSSFSLRNLIPSVGRITNHHTIALSQFPKPSQQPGFSYFVPFGFNRPPRLNHW
jgi:hypothetical protein